MIYTDLAADLSEGNYGGYGDIDSLTDHELELDYLSMNPIEDDEELDALMGSLWEGEEDA